MCKAWVSSHKLFHVITCDTIKKRMQKSALALARVCFNGLSDSMEEGC